MNEYCNIIQTTALAQGKNMASTNMPNKGAPATPQIVIGIWTIDSPMNGAK